MEQELLFHERIEDAIAAVADRIGRKRLAKELWPDKSERDAHNLFDACLNPERKERFSPSQLMFLAKRGRGAGYHAILCFMCLASTLGYSEPTPVDPRDELADLLRVSIEARRAAAKLDERIERLLEASQQPRAIRSVA